MTLAIEPGSPEWLAVITPSKVAAILGVSRWESSYRLWHRMKSLVDSEPPKDIFDMGHDFEPAAAAIWRRRNPGWKLSPGEVQTVADCPFGYPTAATLDRRACRGRARRVVEFKTARHLEEWGDFFTDQAPADYVAQVIAEMMFTGYTQHPAHLMVLGPYFEAHTYEIPYDPQVGAVIADRCREFWHSLKGDMPPDLDDTVATYECVRELHPEINGSTVEVDLGLAVQVLDWNRELKGAETRLRGLKTQLLDRMGNAQTAICQGIKVADRRPHARGGVALNLAMKNVDELFELRHPAQSQEITA
jgi:predicted phage-related endonuclease